MMTRVSCRSPITASIGIVVSDGQPAVPAVARGIDAELRQPAMDRPVPAVLEPLEIVPHRRPPTSSRRRSARRCRPSPRCADRRRSSRCARCSRRACPHADRECRRRATRRASRRTSGRGAAAASSAGSGGRRSSRTSPRSRTRTRGTPARRSRAAAAIGGGPNRIAAAQLAWIAAGFEQDDRAAALPPAARPACRRRRRIRRRGTGTGCRVKEPWERDVRRSYRSRFVHVRISHARFRSANASALARPIANASSERATSKS